MTEPDLRFSPLVIGAALLVASWTIVLLAIALAALASTTIA